MVPGFGDQLMETLFIKHTRNVVSGGRRDFSQQQWRQISEQRGGHLAPYFGKRIAIEEKKGRGAVHAAEEAKRLLQSHSLFSAFFPADCARLVSFRIKPVLRVTSFTRSLVEADDRLPVPVVEKSGSAL